MKKVTRRISTEVKLEAAVNAVKPRGNIRAVRRAFSIDSSITINNSIVTEI